jgi:hypothetical protein
MLKAKLRRRDERIKGELVVKPQKMLIKRNGGYNSRAFWVCLALNAPIATLGIVIIHAANPSVLR